jgi:hypothetical protein
MGSTSSYLSLRQLPRAPAPLTWGRRRIPKPWPQLTDSSFVDPSIQALTTRRFPINFRGFPFPQPFALVFCDNS